MIKRKQETIGSERPISN